MYPSTSVVREGLTRKETQEQKLEGHRRIHYRLGKAVQISTAMAAAQRPTLGTLEKEQVAQRDSNRTEECSLQLFFRFCCGQG